MDATDQWVMMRGHVNPQENDSRIYLSINRRGVIAMNRSAWWQLDNYYRVAVYFNPAENAIGIKVPSKFENSLFYLRAYGRGKKMRMLSAGRMFRRLGITFDRTIKFINPEIHMQEGLRMIVLRLNEGVPIERKVSATDGFV